MQQGEDRAERRRPAIQRQEQREYLVFGEQNEQKEKGKKRKIAVTHRAKIAAIIWPIFCGAVRFCEISP